MDSLTDLPHLTAADLGAPPGPRKPFTFLSIRRQVANRTNGWDAPCVS